MEEIAFPSLAETELSSGVSPRQSGPRYPPTLAGLLLAPNGQSPHREALAGVQRDPGPFSHSKTRQKKEKYISVSVGIRPVPQGDFHTTDASKRDNTPLPTIKPSPIHRVLVIAPVSPHAGACLETTPLKKEGFLFQQWCFCFWPWGTSTLKADGSAKCRMRCATQASQAQQVRAKAEHASQPHQPCSVLRQARMTKRAKAALR